MKTWNSENSYTARENKIVMEMTALEKSGMISPDDRATSSPIFYPKLPHMCIKIETIMFMAALCTVTER